MIEVVFNESACGALKMAQRYGVGQYRGGRPNYIFALGKKRTEEGLEAKLREAEEKERRAWEDAIPLGGDPGDVYCLEFAWSVGEISEEEIGPQRQRVLEQPCLDLQMVDAQQESRQKLQRSKDALAAVCVRSAAGEAIRIWYSHNPDELCGFYWLMAELHRLRDHGPIHMVKLPEWECTDDDTVIWHNGWGEVGRGRVGHYLPLQQEVSPAFLAGCASHWRRLQEENAPLRVVLNGRLVSAPADIYDSFIGREIAARDREFMEARLIGDVLGKYQLGISDTWVHLRIEEMIRGGILEVTAEAPEDRPVYSRMLQKRAQ